MAQHPSKPVSPGCRSLWRIALVAVALLPAGCGRNDQSGTGDKPATQANPPPQTQPATSGQPPVVPAKPLSELESLVAPIALYPDPLLAELLVAATYPLEVVQASRWLDAKPDIATLHTKGWDASIMRLAEVPQVLKMMSNHLDWTTQLGDAFLAKPAEVMDTIQTLRGRAAESGFLKDTPEQKVTRKTVSVPQPPKDAAPGTEVKATPSVVKKEVVYIESAKSDTVYVPQYDIKQAYSAPLAPPPATTASADYGTVTSGYAYPATAPAAAPTYYPTYVPATTTTATSSTDPWLNFGAGAVVGGLLTWGIMEWTEDDHDDWDDHYRGGYYPPVSHDYGNTVCRNGTCWHGGGAGGYNNVSADRGNVTRSRTTTISGNEINISRDGTFSQDQLNSLKQRTAWEPDVRHRRGQQFPEQTQQRLGRIQAPALAGGRLSAPEAIPATARGFAPASRSAEQRPSSAEVRERLAQPPASQNRAGAKPAQQARLSPSAVQGRLERGQRDDALNGVKVSGQEASIASRRGAESRKIAAIQPRDSRPQQQRPKTTAGSGLDRQRTEQARQVQAPNQNQAAERRAQTPRSPERTQAAGGGRVSAQERDVQRRSEATRPTAFEGVGSTARTQNFSQRGAASRQNMAATGPRNPGGRAGGAASSFRGGGGRPR